MQRRAFIKLFGGAAVGWPLTAHAQQPAMALVGLLSAFQLDDRLISAVREGLKDAGYVEGRSVAIKYRSAGGRFDRLPAMAVDLVSDPAAVIRTGPVGCSGRQKCNCNHPDRSGARCRPCGPRPRFQSQPSRRKCYGRDFFYQLTRGKTI